MPLPVQDYVAIEDLDFTGFPGIDGSIIPITIPIIDDSLAEITESISVNLSETQVYSRGRLRQ
jgi:hypothetical protein